jgi:hypothetical protein
MQRLHLLSLLEGICRSSRGGRGSATRGRRRSCGRSGRRRELPTGKEEAAVAATAMEGRKRRLGPARRRPRPSSFT